MSQEERTMDGDDARMPAGGEGERTPGRAPTDVAETPPEPVDEEQLVQRDPQAPQAPPPAG
jgi:hypothetical protein